MPHVTISAQRTARITALLERGISVGEIAKQLDENWHVVERIERQRVLDRLLGPSKQQAAEKMDPDVARYRAEKARRRLA